MRFNIYFLDNLYFCILGILLGLTVRHYFYDYIPFTKFFGFIEKIIYSFIKFIKKLFCLIITNRSAITETALSCANEFKKTVSGEDLLEFQQDYTHVLLEDDIDPFIKEIERHPYDTPSLENCFIRNGVAWYDFQALRLSKQYEELDNRSLIRMLERIIQKYMRSTRKTSSVIHIVMATPTRFYFGMALSKYGERELLKLQQNYDSIAIDNTVPVLEEEVIDLFSEKDSDVT